MLNPLFKEFLSELQQYEDENIEAVVEGHALWQNLEATAKRFEDKVAGAACILSEKKQARLLENVLAGFKAHEDIYGPPPVWQYRPLDKEGREVQLWAAQMPVINHFQLRLSQTREYARWICDYGLSIYDEAEIPVDYSGEVIVELCSQLYQSIHTKLLGTYTQLAGTSKAEKWVLGRENRLLRSLQEAGKPYRDLTIQESWEHYWPEATEESCGQVSQATTQPAIEALGLNSINGILTVPAPAPEDDPAMLRPRRRIALLHFLRGDLGEAINSPKMAEALFLRYNDKGANLRVLAKRAIRDWSDKGSIENVSQTHRHGVIEDIKYIMRYLTSKQKEEANRYVKALENKGKR